MQRHDDQRAEGESARQRQGDTRSGNDRSSEREQESSDNGRYDQGRWMQSVYDRGRHEDPGGDSGERAREEAARERPEGSGARLSQDRSGAREGEYGRYPRLHEDDEPVAGGFQREKDGDD